MLRGGTQQKGLEERMPRSRSPRRAREEASGEARREGGGRGEEERPGKFERHSDAQVRGGGWGDVTCAGAIPGPQPAQAGPRDRQAQAHGRLGDTAAQVGTNPCTLQDQSPILTLGNEVTHQFCILP